MFANLFIGQSKTRERVKSKKAEYGYRRPLTVAINETSISGGLRGCKYPEFFLKGQLDFRANNQRPVVRTWSSYCICCSKWPQSSCGRNFKGHSQARWLLELIGIRKVVIFMVIAYYSKKRYKTAKRKGAWEKSQEKPSKSFHVTFPSGVAWMHLIFLIMMHDNTCKVPPTREDHLSLHIHGIFLVVSHVGMWRLCEWLQILRCQSPELKTGIHH